MVCCGCNSELEYLEVQWNKPLSTNTLIWNHVSEEHSRISQAVTKSIPAPTHAEWTATITGLGHWVRGKKKAGDKGTHEGEGKEKRKVDREEEKKPG